MQERVEYTEFMLEFQTKTNERLIKLQSQIDGNVKVIQKNDVNMKQDLQIRTSKLKEESDTKMRAVDHDLRAQADEVQKAKKAVDKNKETFNNRLKKALDANAETNERMNKYQEEIREKMFLLED